VTSLHYPEISLTSKGLRYQENSSAGSSAERVESVTAAPSTFSGRCAFAAPRLLPFLRQVVKGGLDMHRTMKEDLDGNLGMSGAGGRELGAPPWGFRLRASRRRL